MAGSALGMAFSLLVLGSITKGNPAPHVAHITAKMGYSLWG